MSFDSSRLSKAMDIAARSHSSQCRIGTTIPYFAHPLAVASLVLEFGGGEDQVLAALTHDAIEDGGAAYAAEIREALGEPVLALAVACSDGSAESKAAAASNGQTLADGWQRQRAQLERLEDENLPALLVTACDTLHSARCLLTDLEAIGPSVFDRFTAGREGALRYYTQAAAILSKRQSPVAAMLRATVTRIREVAAASEPLEAALLALRKHLKPSQLPDFRRLIDQLNNAAQHSVALGSRALAAASHSQQHT